MKILVTGGAGFIGSHIVDAYLAEGHEVAILDDLSTGSRDQLNPKARFYEIDVRDPAIEEVFKKEKPEVVNHQAARANVRESMEKPLLYAEVNVLGSLNILECARKNGVKKVVYASTGGAVYGEPQTLPVTEDHPINPLDPYGASKHHVEHYLYLYAANYGLGTTVLRYPNVYGPRQDPHGEAGVVAIFTGKMLDGEDPVIHGTGDQERDFIYVGDVVRANVQALEKGDRGIYNIGTGRATSVNQVFDALAKLTNYAGKKVHGPAKLGEVYRIFLDPALAARDLSWTAQMDLEQGLDRTVEFFRRKKSQSA